MSSPLPVLIPFPACYDISPFGPETQECLHIFDERPSPYGNTARPFVLTDCLSIYQVFLYPSFDDFVKSPTSALRFISLSLRRTTSTPHDTRFARLEFGAFYKAVCKSTFYEVVILWNIFFVNELSPQIVFKRFGLSNASKWMLTDIPEKAFDLIQHAAIRTFPVVKILRSNGGELDLELQSIAFSTS